MTVGWPSLGIAGPKWFCHDLHRACFTELEFERVPLCWHTYLPRAQLNSAQHDIEQTRKMKRFRTSVRTQLCPCRQPCLDAEDASKTAQQQMVFRSTKL